VREERVRHLPITKPSDTEEPWVTEVFGRPMHPDRPYTAEDAKRERQHREGRQRERGREAE